MPKKERISKIKKQRARSPKKELIIFNRKYLFILLLILLPVIILAVIQYRSYRIKAQAISISCTPGDCVLGGGVGLRWISFDQMNSIISIITGENSCIPAPDASCGSDKIQISENTVECSPFHPQGIEGIDLGLIFSLRIPPEGVCVGKKLTCNLATGYIEDLGPCDSPSTDNQISGVPQTPPPNNTSCRKDCALCNYNDQNDRTNGCKPETLCNGEAKWCWPFGYNGSPSTPGSINNPGSDQTGENCASKNCNWYIFCVKGIDYPGKECIPNGNVCADKPDKDVCRDGGCTGCR